MDDATLGALTRKKIELERKIKTISEELASIATALESYTLMLRADRNRFTSHRWDQIPDKETLKQKVQDLLEAEVLLKLTEEQLAQV